jgi:two-component sensor histidine kinase
MARRIARGELLHGLLVNELNHRVKNTLATVQSIAAQTFRRTGDATEARRKFDARLASLGRAHDVLSDEKWHSAEMREVVESVLEPHAVQESGRVHISGPDMRLEPARALMVSMALHELATNAAKYGALSNASGVIFVDWAAVAGGKLLRLTWREAGGPPVQRPERKGFGSKLIEEAFAHQAQGRATLDFKPEGLVCILECPHT